MRLKNVKNAKMILEQGKYYVKNASDYKGKWSNYFNNDNPIYIEIGTGKGNFIIKNAINNPDINYIGIEKFDSVLVRAIQKSNDLEVDNLKFIRMDAENILDVFDKEVDKIFLNFSDPWPKDRHAKRRLTCPIFLNKYKAIFKDDVIIEMKTDNIDLFNYSYETLLQNNYEIVYLTNDLHNENVDNITTEYEEKFASKGIKINKLIAISKNKNGNEEH